MYPRGLFVFLLVAAACSSSSGEDENNGDAGAVDAGNNEAGSPRLVGLNRHDQPLADETIEPSSGRFLDRKLNTVCAFTPVSETEFRCLPVEETTSSVYFADAECKQPLVVVPACAKKPEYALFDSGGTYSANGVMDRAFGAPNVLLQVAGPTPPLVALYLGGGGACSLVTEALIPPADAQWFATTPLDASAFAKASLTYRRSASGALEKPDLTLEQGLVLTRYFRELGYDTKNTSACPFVTPSDPKNKAACELAEVLSFPVYSEATCTTAGVDAVDRGDSSVRFVVKDDGTTHAVTGRDNSFAYRKDEGVCSSTADPYTLLTLGPALTLSTATVESTPKGDVELISFDSEGLRFFKGYSDSKSHLPCADELMGTDGKEHCLTEAYSSLVVYSDSECTTPVFLFDPGTDVARVPVANTCLAEFRLYRRGSEIFIGDTMYLTDSFSRCRGVKNGSLKSYAIGDEVDVNALPVIDDTQ
ncbi:MAG TPA: hypothetical protein VM925_05760 [Labilithrix sp.]|nr:hypothetical protein [Labilithrix sp.]